MALLLRSGLVTWLRTWLAAGSDPADAATATQRAELAEPSEPPEPPGGLSQEIARILANKFLDEQTKEAMP